MRAGRLHYFYFVNIVANAIPETAHTQRSIEWTNALVAFVIAFVMSNRLKA